jgi:hypothetical protein
MQGPKSQIAGSQACDPSNYAGTGGAAEGATGDRGSLHAAVSTQEERAARLEPEREFVPQHGARFCSGSCGSSGRVPIQSDPGALGAGVV